MRDCFYLNGKTRYAETGKIFMKYTHFMQEEF